MKFSMTILVIIADELERFNPKIMDFKLLINSASVCSFTAKEPCIIFRYVQPS